MNSDYGMDKYVDLIKKYFLFLEQEYKGHFISAERKSLIFYILEKSQVRFALDRNQLFLSIQPCGVDEWFDLSIVILAKDPQSNFRYEYLTEQNYEKCIQNLSTALAKYGKDLLGGDATIQQAYIAAGKEIWKKIKAKDEK